MSEQDKRKIWITPAKNLSCLMNIGKNSLHSVTAEKAVILLSGGFTVSAKILCDHRAAEGGKMFHKRNVPAVMLGHTVYYLEKETGFFGGNHGCGQTSAVVSAAAADRFPKHGYPSLSSSSVVNLVYCPNQPIFTFPVEP